MKKDILKLTLTGTMLLAVSTVSIFAQDKKAEGKEQHKEAATESSDRGVMNNAASNTGPRPINIGLPGGVGGTTVIGNGIPVVYTQWPALPTKLWRRDNSIVGFQLNDLASTMLNYGDLGFSVATIANTGTPFHMGSVTINSNHFGLLRTSLGMSGPLNKKGLSYSLGAYISYDPGTFKNDAERFFQDQTQMYKMALSQTYNQGKGRVGVFYKYANSKGVLLNYAPYRYKKGGKVEEIDGFKIGGNSFFDNTGRVQYLNPFTKQIEDKDAIDDFGTESHAVDIVGSNKLNNGWNLAYTLRYQKIDAGVQVSATGASVLNDGVSPQSTFYNLDGSRYEGLAFGTYKMNSNTPLTNYAARFELAKKTSNHNFKIALMNQYYGLDKYEGTTTWGYQAFGSSPAKIIRGDLKGINDAVPGKQLGTDKYGNISSYYNRGLEYYDGNENKLALTFSDKWEVTELLDLNYGARLEYKSINGEWAPEASRRPLYEGLGATMEASSPIYLDPTKFAPIDGNYLSMNATLGAVYKLTNKFGLTAEGGVFQIAPTLENYAGAIDPQIKKSTIPNAGAGVFFNDKWISLVSKATYISRDDNVARIREKNPANPLQTDIQVVNYKMQTLGWTADAIIRPFKNFEVHALLTIQNPLYKNYKGTFTFGDDKTDFNFNDQTVSGISKVLIEIDPSYQLDKLKFWANLRYFSKQYVNMSNSVFYAPRIETFAGINYQYNPKIDFGLIVVNPLNQRGAQGKVEELDLYLQEQVDKQLINSALSGSYIRPFTVEVSATVKF